MILYKLRIAVGYDQDQCRRKFRAPQSLAAAKEEGILICKEKVECALRHRSALRALALMSGILTTYGVRRVAFVVATSVADDLV